MLVILSMVFSFTFFTYNGQRLFRLRKKVLQLDNTGTRLQWVIKYKTTLIMFTVLSGIIGLVFSYFVNINCFIVLIPMGILSVFYVIPIIPFYSKSPTLRELPYLKIIFIGIVWSLTIVWLPLIETAPTLELPNLNLLKSLAQNFLFVIAITLPFDVRDIKFDKTSNLKTFPRLIGVKGSNSVSLILLMGSIYLLYFLPVGADNFYALLMGHIITMIMVASTKENRKELFFAGLIEGSVIVLYVCVLISEYCSFL